MTVTPLRYWRAERPPDHDGAAIGANATLLPGVCIGEGALVAAGAIVTRDVPAHKLAIGAPAKITDLPRKMVRKYPKNNHSLCNFLIFHDRKRSSMSCQIILLFFHLSDSLSDNCITWQSFMNR